jgi:hypothetical protein
MSDPAERVAVLRDRVEAREEEFGAAMHDLVEAARQSADPASWIRSRPLLCATGALALGWWLGNRARRDGRSRR